MDEEELRRQAEDQVRQALDGGANAGPAALIFLVRDLKDRGATFGEMVTILASMWAAGFVQQGKT
jgi:hypothetical protein